MSGVRMVLALLVLILISSAPAWSEPPKAAKSSVPVRFLPASPESLTLCGERIPLDRRDIDERMEREFTIAVHDTAQVVMWMKRAARYFPYISARLKAAGLPDDLKYLAVAESSLITHIRSKAGAVGPWQFITGTGRRYHLRRNQWFDDRRDIELATSAAIAYLKDLHAEFNNWALAMAAYNCGEQRVRRELAEQGVTSYYDLHLPMETMRYIFRIASAKVILGDPAKYGYHLPSGRLFHPVPSEPVRIKLTRSTHVRDLAQACGITFHAFKELNPSIRGYYLPQGTHRLRVPPGKAGVLAQRLKSVKPTPPPTSEEWVVQPGDTLSLIAQRTGVNVRVLRRANRLDGHRIFPGQRLVIPGKTKR